MNTASSTQPEKNIHKLRSIAGVILVIAGAVLFLEQYLRTGWLSLMILPGIGIYLYIWGARLRSLGLLVGGGLLGGIGFGIAAAFNPAYPHQPILSQAGNVLLCFALGWVVVLFGSTVFLRRTIWWAMIPGGVVGALAVWILYSQFRWPDLALLLGLGLGLPLLIWGLVIRLFGLTIPGSLIATMGPGVFVAWGVPQEPNGLVQTGVMLVWFSLGWILITLWSRVLFNKFAWWPLIPGGILAMVGFGLYIGGDPSNALLFISNTGSIGLMIFGLYLLLMRKGIHH